MVNPILFSSYPIPRVIPTQESSCCCNSKKWFKGNYLTPLCPEPDLGKKQIPVNTGNYALVVDNWSFYSRKEHLISLTLSLTVADVSVIPEA